MFAMTLIPARERPRNGHRVGMVAFDFGMQGDDPHPEVWRAASSRRNKEDYMEYIRRCAQNSTALEVKIADLKHNMDITRLDKLTNEDLKRLKKYHKAYRYLWGIYNAKRDD